MLKSDVSIVGAGPAGTIAALFLAKAGIRCTLLDKASFPRDKICGDGISGWVLTILHELDPNFLMKLSRQPFLLHSHGIRISAPNATTLDLPFYNDNRLPTSLPPGFIARRLDFDHFLVEEAREKSEISLFENFEVTGFRKEDQGITLESKTGEAIRSDLVIFASGVNSKFMKEPGGIFKDRKNTMTGIKTYFKGVTGFHEKNYVELHFLKDLLPGYFWIFPLPGNMANVGVGLDQYRIGKRKISLKNIMFEAIRSEPHLRDRFKNAKQETKVEAYNLPLWDRRRSISGERFMLTGDAASLVDPVTGEGMGHAAISGMLAAKQAVRCLEQKDFSAKFMQGYDDSFYQRIGKELSISAKIPKFIRHAWLFNSVMNRAVNSKVLQEKLSKAMTDLEVRKRLHEPSLYLKVLLGM
ncbi:MAG: geranylgeranyl reductase family protein [Bacteroidetes bacterium]|nr:geranylgeranyl reductase family protein [Bacteroidota bacterium]